jgi:hypothetical protein
MSSHTTYFCDVCNSDRETQQSADDGRAVTYTEYPVGDGWAEFTKRRASGYGEDEMHVCAHCLASPDFDGPWEGFAVSEWDENSAKNVEKGRAHAEVFRHAQETLGTWDRWYWRGVKQVFDSATSYPYGYRVGPKMEDGRFSPGDQVYERRAA